MLRRHLERNVLKKLMEMIIFLSSSGVVRKYIGDMSEVLSRILFASELIRIFIKCYCHPPYLFSRASARLLILWLKGISVGIEVMTLFWTSPSVLSIFVRRNVKSEVALTNYNKSNLVSEQRGNQIRCTRFTPRIGYEIGDLFSSFSFKCCRQMHISPRYSRSFCYHKSISGMFQPTYANI